MFDVRSLGSGYSDLERHRAKRSAQVACQVLSRVDRTLAGDSNIRVVPEYGIASSAPAFSTDTTVNINFTHQVFRDIHGDKAFVHLLGLNHHELSHLLYTPWWSDVPNLRYESECDTTFRDGYNILEDGRIERLMSTEYPSVQPMLVSVFMNMAAIAPDMTSLWLITAPRKSILPKKVYRAIRKAALKEGKYTIDNVKAMEAIVAKYIDLVPVNQEAKTIALVHEYKDFIRTDTQNHLGECSAHTSGQVLSGKLTRRRNRKQQESLTKEAKSKDAASESKDDGDDNEGSGSGSQGAQGSKAKDKPLESGSGGAGGEDSDDGPESDTDGSGDGSGDGAGKNGDSSGHGQSGDDAGDDQGNANGASNTGHGDDNALPVLEAINEAQSDIMNSESVLNELQNHSRAIRNGSSFVSASKSRRVSQLEVPTPDMVRAAKKVGMEFSKLQAQLDPGWDRRTQSGKLNVKRYLEGADLDEVFDTWREDHSDASDVEAFLALDLSSSMNSGGTTGIPPYWSAAQSFWVIRTALTKIGAKVTGYSYSDSAAVLFSRDEKQAKSKYPVWGASGGTDPSSTIDDAGILLGRSKSKSRVFITLTDGDWAGDREGQKMMLDDMRSAGIVTCMYRIGDPTRKVHQYLQEMVDHFDVFAMVNDPVGIIQPVKDTIKQLIKRKAGR